MSNWSRVTSSNPDPHPHPNPNPSPNPNPDPDPNPKPSPNPNPNQALLRGLSKVTLNEAALAQELDVNWEVLA